MLRDSVVGHLDVQPVAVGRERDDGQLDLVVPAPVLLFELLVRHRQPLGDRLAELLDHQRAADALLELGGRHRRPLRRQELLVALRADEHAVFLQRRDRVDALGDLLVADRQPEALGLGQRRAFLDHLLENLLLDAELLQQLFVHLAAVGRPGRPAAGPAYGPAELVGANLVTVDRGDRVGRGGVGVAASQELGDVEDYKREADESQAPLEPVPVPSHPVKHGHSGFLGNLDLMPHSRGVARDREGTVWYICRL